ncbi:hypothetical protein [Nevskia sp.]|uniref:hypothetical protein n=1 Tax=Nevskia sp. TaxID=1929292 RepID=UPI0025D673E6|nr:hypothetical protein [Nevskia sp.]
MKLVADGRALAIVERDAHGQVFYEVATFSSWKVRAAATVHGILPQNHRLFPTFEGISGAASNRVRHYIGALTGLAESIETGLLDELETQIVEKVSADDLAVAQEAFDSSGTNLSFVAAAVLAGATLERALRRKCEGLGIDILRPNGDRKAMNALIDALRAANAISPLRDRQMKVWAAIRNDAAHGDFDKFNRGDVQGFLRDLPAVLAELA